MVYRSGDLLIMLHGAPGETHAGLPYSESTY